MVIDKDTIGRPMTLQIDGHTVELTRQDAYDLVLAYCYDGDEVCTDNAAGFCIHALEAFLESAKLIGTTVTIFHHEEVAHTFAPGVGGRVYGLRSAQTPNGEGQRWVVAK